VQALLRYRSKTAKMQKFPIDSHSNKNFISPFSARRGPPTPKRGEDTFGTRVCSHAKFGVNWPAGCREIVDKKMNETAKVNKYLAFRSNERMAGKKRQNCRQSVVAGRQQLYCAVQSRSPSQMSRYWLSTKNTANYFLA